MDMQQNEEARESSDEEEKLPESLPEQFQKRYQEDENFSFLNNYFGSANIIFNTGTINGNLVQTQSDGSRETEDVLRLKKEDDFSHFYQRYRNSSVFSAMLVLAVLEIVPENEFSFLCRELEKHIPETSGQSGDPSWHRFDSINEILSILQAARIPARLLQDNLEIPISCFTFSDPCFPSWIRREIWEDYFEIREAVTQWVLELKDEARLQGLLKKQITDGMISLAGINYSYAVEHFINSAGQSAKGRDISYLSGLLDGLLKTEHRARVEQLLCLWLKEEGYRWRIAYQIYDPKGSPEWTSLLCRRLEDTLQKDASCGSKDVRRWYYASRGYLMVPAHMNRNAAVLLVRILAERFRGARIFPEQEKVLLYYLILFREDCFFTNERNWRMVLIELCADREIRQQMKALLLLIWHNKKYRDILTDILQFHLSRLPGGEEWHYMQWFLKTLGFTGKKQDYDQLRHVLEQSRFIHRARILDWLEQLRAEKRKEKSK